MPSGEGQRPRDPSFLPGDHPGSAEPTGLTGPTVPEDSVVPGGSADQPPRDACGVFGVWAPDEEVAKLTYFGLYALQHRGQESAGIAVSNGDQILVCKDMGLVSQVFDESTLESLTGRLAIGHCRYSTTGSSVWENAQPTFRATTHGSLALGHNGNLINTAELVQLVEDRADRAGEGGNDATRDAWSHDGHSHPDQPHPGQSHSGRPGPGRTGSGRPGHSRNGRSGGASSTSDTGLISALLASYPEHTVFDAALEVLPALRGAYCLVFMDENTLYAARDPQGIHPLVLGRLAAGWVIASETGALDICGAEYVREIEPGELVAVDERGVRSRRFARAEPKGCLFEYVYLARPDTMISGRSVHETRVEVGRRLARDFPVPADLVIPVPESATPAAIGYAEESGIPYGHGLIKNSYVGRTFIQPSQTLRQLGIRLKYNPLRGVVDGRRVVMVDDSIVRGNTQQALVKMLRDAGALEVHVRISSPPVKWPCFYGIDFASADELIAAKLTVEEIGRRIGADSLGYISLDELVAATEVPADGLCRACFDGVYPVGVPESAHLGKRQLEIVGASS